MRRPARFNAAVGQGVSCHCCGASTQLPGDLRVPAFQCAFCGTMLETARYAGAAAVSADALVGHISAAVQIASPAVAAMQAPRFEGGSRDTRAASCLRCGAPVAVPLAVEEREFSCGACGQRQAIQQYVSDAERFALDMERQVAGNQALLRLQAEGVPCGKCGGKCPVPDDGSVQLVCTFCGAAILLSDHVDASAVARSRLKHGVFELRDELMRKQAERALRVQWGVIAGVALLVLLFVAANVLFGR